jgi:subtilisin-like proprotein convertase family protein
MKYIFGARRAFVGRRFLVSFSLGLVAVSFALLTFARDPQAVKPKNAVQFHGVASYHNDTSAPARELAKLPAKSFEHESNRNPKIPSRHLDSPDPVVQSRHVRAIDALTLNIPSTILNFDGIPYPGVNCSCHPPDTDGYIGKTQYVQIVNEGYQVFDKTTGASQLGPVNISSIWSGFGGVCETSGQGDPIVLYDHLADRWVITQFAGGSTITDECVAVSTTSDATGSYNRYGFHLGSNFFDYPKLAVWPDAYYMSMNVFDSAGNNYLGPQPFALNRTAMLAGSAATFVSPVSALGSTVDPILPADLDGSTLPTNGAPETFVGFPGASPQYTTYHFHVDFATPANSTWTTFATPSAAGFTQLCSSTQACVPQAGQATANNLDGLGDRLMFRLAYRNFGDHESVVGNFTVSSGGVAGIRWFELRNVTAGPVTVYQESTYQPDSTWRWMGSIAMDSAGNMALGFSASSASINPQIRYAARLAGDPLNTLGQGETTMIAGTGSQGSGNGNRWGDYSAMTVDPVDDHTFWYTNEYYATSGAAWQTRIGNFRFANAPQPIADSATITSDSCNSNGMIDPNETVTVNFAIKNTGTIATSNLVATLQATGGVTNPSGPQTYGAIAPGATVSNPFTFTAGNLACGATLIATLQLQDGATNFGTIAYNFATGTVSVVLSENFDSVTAPALPSGWTAANVSGAAPLWATSTTSPDTSPNDAFVDDPSTVSDKHLDTPSIVITSTTAQVSFRNNYNLESTFDGGVLEVSSPNINGGAFTDITDAAVGGSFASGGYNGTISTSFSSPIAGRQAWTGSSSGYITTVANLGSKVAGQTIKLRFRMGSDNSTSGTGWRVDTVRVLNGYICCGPAVIVSVPPPTLTAESYTPANGAPDPGENVTVSLALANTGGSNTGNLVATLQATGGVTNPSVPQSYGVLTPFGAAVSRSFSFTANGNCGDTITLTLALQDGATNLGTVTFTMTLGTTTTSTQSFSSTATITVPASGTGATTGAPATPYPSNITVSGVPAGFKRLTVTFVGMNHTFPDDVDVLLVSPTGRKMIVLSDAGGSNAWSNTTITLDDDAVTSLSDTGSNGSGTYKPGNFGTAQDPFPSPAPAGTYLSAAPGGTDTLTSAFVGQNPNGVWSLYVVDDASADTGNFSGGWQISFATSSPSCANSAPTITNGPPPSPVIVGTAYSFGFTATGNPTPTFGLTNGSLPTGLSLSTAGLISGTATNGGTGTFANLMVTANNGISPNATQTFTLNTVTREGNYIASFGLSGTNADPSFDYDLDDLANLMEYALGLDPTTANVAGLPSVTIKNYGGTNYLSIMFHRSSLATDITYIVQVSGDMVTWTDVATSAGGAVTSGTGFVAETGSAPDFIVEARDTVPYNGATARFIRLKVTMP